MSYNVELLADSIANGVRLTTAELTFPRFILAEVNTHRVFSRNSASSRAIPTEKIIKRVLEEPFVPETFNKRVKGMGVGEAFDNSEQYACYGHWIQARDASVEHAKWLNEFQVDKSRVNRLLEPFMWHTAIITSTEWDNFFALRDDESAQPEFQIIAHMLREAMNDAVPLELEPDEWHLPLLDLGSEWIEAKETKHWTYWADVSAGRCARSSYDKIHDPENKDESVARGQKLKGVGHMSPFEHQAQPYSLVEVGAVQFYTNTIAASAFLDDRAAKAMIKGLPFSGNLRLWHQYRQSFEHEDNYALLK